MERFPNPSIPQELSDAILGAGSKLCREAVAKYLQSEQAYQSDSRCRAAVFARECVPRLNLISIMIRWLSLGETRMKIIAILAHVAPLTSSLVDPSLVLSTDAIIQSPVRIELDSHATCAQNLHPFLISGCDSASDKDFASLLMLHNKHVYRL
jgi:hypothetical protein